MQSYNKKIKFEKDKDIVLPDFTVTYRGERQVEVKQYVHGYFLLHDFEVVTGKITKTVSWSSGTGEIAPQRFELNGATYELELSYSDYAGRLQDDELVITPVSS